MASSFVGITISKQILILNDLHHAELKACNINVHELKGSYILYYKPYPCPTDSQTICHLKGILTRIRSNKIYESYNDDFGTHIVRIQERSLKHRPLIKVKK